MSIFRRLTAFGVVTLAVVCWVEWSSAVARADSLEGQYLEVRTCQVYTGPCFANGEVGQAGKDAVLAWGIERGTLDGVDLSGLHVAMVVRASDTLGHGGLSDAREVASMVIVDERASEEQRSALVEFARRQTSLDPPRTVEAAPFQMGLDILTLNGELLVGDLIEVKARKARPGDCICSNERAFYPPLTALRNSVPGVTIEGEVKARPLGSRWSVPDSRTAYLGLFEVSDQAPQVAAAAR